MLGSRQSSFENHGARRTMSLTLETAARPRSVRGSRQSAGGCSPLRFARASRRRAERTVELISHEPVWVCPNHLRLAPDHGGQPAANAAEIVRILEQRARQRHRAVPGAVRHRLHLRRSVRPVGAPGRGIRGHRADRPGDRGPRATRRRRRADSRRQQPVQLRRRDRRRLDSGSRPQAVHPQLQGVLRESLVQPGRRQASRPRSSWAAGCVPFGIDLLFEARGEGGRAGHRGLVVVGIEICEDLWVPVPPSCAAGHGRGDDPAQPFGQQRDDRQEPVSHRSGRGPVGPIDRGVCDGRQRAIGIDDRRGFRRPLPDRRERPAAGRVAPGRRRPADPPRLVLRSPGTSTSPSCTPTAGSRPASTTARRS